MARATGWRAATKQGGTAGRPGPGLELGSGPGLEPGLGLGLEIGPGSGLMLGVELRPGLTAVSDGTQF